MTDAELRGQLLRCFYDLRHSNGGWVPTSDIILSGGPLVDRHMIGGICGQLADANLIRWKPLIGAEEGFIIGMAQITALGVDVIDRAVTPPIVISLAAERSRSTELDTPSSSEAVAQNGKAPRRAVILTALGVETSAVLRHLANLQEENVRGTVFHVGEFEGWTVAVAECGEGNASAAATIERGIAQFEPEVAAFVGVAGGVKDVSIGDIVVASKVYGYDRGKDTKSGFEARPTIQLPAYALEQRVRAIRQKSDWRRRLAPGFGQALPRIEIGAIAAGEKVIASASGAIARFLRENYGDTLAVEMEGYGFLAGVHINSPVHGCVIRGISDLLDGKANADKAGTQQRAADAASALTFEILATSNAPGTKKPSSRSAQPAAASNPASTRRLRPTPSTVSPAIYFQPGESLAEFGEEYDKVEFTYPDATGFYLRVVPDTPPTKPFSRAQLLGALRASAMYAMWRNPSGLFAPNRYGAIVVEPESPVGGPLRASTQLLESGEVWGLAKWLFVTNRREYGNMISAIAFERLYRNMLPRYVDVLVTHLKLAPPFTVDAGAVGINTFKLAVDDENMFGPIYDSEFCGQYDLADASARSMNDLLLQFFDDFFGITGYPRPANLDGFGPVGG